MAPGCLIGISGPGLGFLTTVTHKTRSGARQLAAIMPHQTVERLSSAGFIVSNMIRGTKQHVPVFCALFVIVPCSELFRV